MTPNPATSTSAGGARSRRSLRVLVAAIAALLMAGALTVATPQVASASASPRIESTQVTNSLDRLRTDGMLIESSARPDVVLRPASTFGRSLFNGVAFAGGQVVVAEVLKAMGYNPDSGLAAAMKEINDSIAALNDEVRRISEQIERVLEGQDRANFYNSYTQAGIASANLDTAMRSVTNWIEKDLKPSESNLSDMQTVITTSIGQLDFLLANPTTGTIPLMMKAADPATVSDLDQYWTQIDTARDDYRAVLAQGLATLSAMERWDTTGTIAADLATFTPRATQTVAKMYEFGIGLDAKRVHVKDRDTILADVNVTSVSGESSPTKIRNRNEVEPHLKALADTYRPSDHGGQTLEAYLTSKGVPTSVNYLDTYRWAFDRGHVSVKTVGQIAGNAYKAVDVQFGTRYAALDPEGQNKAFIQANQQSLKDGPGAAVLGVSLNVGGRAANTSPEAVKQAAFGLK